MKKEQRYYLYRLKEEFSKRQSMNSSYSLRAYANFLEIHPSALSLILKGSRILPVKDITKVANRLKLSPEEKVIFMQSVIQSGRQKVKNMDISEEQIKKFQLDESYFKVIAEWEHYAILNLINTAGFESSKDWISRRLSITIDRAQIVLEHLVHAGLLEVCTDGTFRRTEEAFKTTEDIISSALVSSHKESLEMGIKKIDQVNLLLRDFSSMTMSINLEKLGEAKRVIRDFRKKLSNLLTEGAQTEVYQCCIQLYPLTEIRGIGENAS